MTRFFYREASIKAVEIAERFADGKATQQDLDAAEWPAETPTFGIDFHLELNPNCPERKEWTRHLLDNGLERDLEGEGNQQVPNSALNTKLFGAACLALYCLRNPPLNEWTWRATAFAKVDWPGKWLVNCVFGNPFHPSYVQPAWRSSACVQLAEDAFYRRTRENFLDRSILLALAAELECCGCSDALILDHLRSTVEHVQGCRVLDLILGKN